MIILPNGAGTTYDEIWCRHIDPIARFDGKARDDESVMLTCEKDARKLDGVEVVRDHASK